MNKNELLLRFHKELRHETLMPGYVREETKHVIRHTSKFGEKGFIIASYLNEINAREIIKQELIYFNAIGQEFEWKVYSYDQPDNLKELLIEEGFTMDEQEALMVLQLEQHPFLSASGLQDVKEIKDFQGIQDIVTLEDTIWNESHAELGERLWRDKQDQPDSLFLYGIYEGEKLVSAAWMYLELNSSFTSLWGGSTLPEFRGKGYYTKLLTIRAQKAYAMGYPFLTVDASPMSRPILEKHGFCCLAYTYGCQSPSIK